MTNENYSIYWFIPYHVMKVGFEWLNYIKFIEEKEDEK
jgi:hypothetical protein